MHAIKAKIPVFCGYAVILAAISLMGYTAACAPRPEEQWNSYYYGTTPVYEQGIEYYQGMDADDNYTLPADMAMPDGDRNTVTQFPPAEHNLQDESLLHGNRMR